MSISCVYNVDIIVYLVKTSLQFFKQSLKTLQSLNKALSRKVKGSGNWYRACRALARQHRKVARQREDWQWKLATELCTEFDTLCFETLNLESMKHLWGLSLIHISEPTRPY